MAASTQDGLVLTDKILSSPFAESYRALRANIGFSSIDRPVKNIVVTSAAPREGKTTTVINLGIVMAQAGARTILVDADFRRSMLHRFVAGAQVRRKAFWSDEDSAPPGLSGLIVGNAEPKDVLVPTQFKDLAVLPAGITPPNPSELLGSERMRAVLEQLSEEADYVVIDSPPCGLYSDAVVVSRIADGVLYVLRSGPQDKVVQRRIQKQLQQAKARLLGVVFNGADVEADVSSYAYYYPNGAKRDKNGAKRGK
jgi:capsular exopolysaccharide synthesis family protein